MSEKTERKTSLILLGPENDIRAARILYCWNLIFFFFFFFFFLFYFFFILLFFFFFFFFFFAEAQNCERPPEIGANPALYIHLWKRVLL